MHPFPPTAVVTPCPHCRMPNDGHLHPDGTPPQDGNLGLCIHCGQLAMYVVGFYSRTIYLRKLTEDELAEVLQNPEVAETLTLLQQGLTPYEANARRRTFNG